MVQTLLRHSSIADWASTLDSILPDVHEVDRAATRIWSAFFPLALADAYADADDPLGVTRRLRIDGNARLRDGQIDSSHWFLYGHRYWPVVKASIVSSSDRDSAHGVSDLASVVRSLSADAALRASVDAWLLTGIVFVGLMTLRQTGIDAFRASASGGTEPSVNLRLSPEAIVARRARDDGQGALGFLRSTRRFSVVFDERSADARFPILDSQHLTTAAALDGRDYTGGPRRFQEGPIPAQCRSATCGTCWVGVLGGQQKLNEIEPYEARRLNEFGYITVEEPKPMIRLACQARASGNVTIVIPSWHGLPARLRAVVPASPPTGANR